MKTTSSKIPKTSPYSDDDAPFFSACGKKNVYANVCLYIVMRATHIERYVLIR